MRSLLTDTREWIETDGLGGFASGPVIGPRSRRYHGLLLAATTPPTGRLMLVNGLDALVETAAGRFPISSQRYLPDTVHPDGAMRIDAFEPAPWPSWRFGLADGTVVEQEVLAAQGMPAVAVTFRLAGGSREASLVVRLFLSGRDYHALHHENPAFRFDPVIAGERITWHPYPGVPGIAVLTNGRYHHEPFWYRNVLYTEERARGLDHVEDLAAPGVLRFDLGREEAILILSADLESRPSLPEGASAKSTIARLRASERRRRDAFPTRLHRAADSYLVRRGEGRSIVAGYPWFTDWGRDTFIALRGLCLSAGRLDEARAILLEWSGSLSEGMLPNRFPDRGEAPEYNAVDASLWFVVAVSEFLRAAAPGRSKPKVAETRRLEDAVRAILDGYA
ncbi:MAG TPA: glycogen debranching enzyme N-terminal domain-containing protein, partial [Candidatus Polarisedimenticolia bacterium]|nr:glycogen debranching enzyme N-terminal domain-containing protein [Candidatus Polarisedimenticolia bacterium]